MKYIDVFLSFVYGIIIASIFIISGYNIGKQEQASQMTDRCKSTGMYLTEGYAISCRVLTNEGYAPMIEQTKGK